MIMNQLQQEQRVASGRLMRDPKFASRPVTSDVVFDVVSVTDGGVWLQPEDGKAVPFSHEYVRTYFTAYPPQPKPDRVDQLAQETDGWEPLTAYQVTFCPIDDRPLEPGHRVVEAYAGALVDAGRCATCGRFFANDTLTEIKLWKES
jgi:hypothetical protein